MRNIKMLATFLACIALGCVNAQFPRRKPASDIYTWNVEIDDAGTMAKQKAVALKSRDAVFLFTYGKGELKEHNLTASSMLMEYSDPAGVLAIRFGSRRKGICFLIPMSETLEQIKVDLETKSGGNITLPNTVAVNGTGEPLTREEANAVFAQHPTMKPFCYRSPIVETNTMTLGEEDPDTKTVTMLGWDSRVALMLRGGGNAPSRGDDNKSEEKPKRRWPRRRFPRRRG